MISVYTEVVHQSYRWFSKSLFDEKTGLAEELQSIQNWITCLQTVPKSYRRIIYSVCIIAGILNELFSFYLSYVFNFSVKAEHFSEFWIRLKMNIIWVIHNFAQDLKLRNKIDMVIYIYNFNISHGKILLKVVFF